MVSAYLIFHLDRETLVLVDCSYKNECSGCDYLGLPYEDQIDIKNKELKAMLNEAGVIAPEEIHFVKIREFGLRDRLDMTISTRDDGITRVGLYAKSKKDIVDIKECKQLSVPLQNWLVEFRATVPKIEKGSFRLRVSPSGKKGVWLDLSNIVVKELLDDEAWFRKLLKLAHVVEVGQKRKRLIDVNGQLKLTDPSPQNWFETYSFQEEGVKRIPIKTTIGGFTQPGFEANRALCETVFNTIAKSVGTPSKSKWVELGCGAGNFTPILSHFANELIAVDLDEEALMSLVQNIEVEDFANSKSESLKFPVRLKTKNCVLQVVKLNFHKPSETLKDLLKDTDGLFVDPPRSGLGDTCTVIASLTVKPRYLVYVSCFPKSFVSDVRRLSELGYKIDSLHLVDQFPQTTHYELVALLTN